MPCWLTLFMLDRLHANMFFVNCSCMRLLRILAAALVDSFRPRYLASLATREFTKNGPGIVLTHRTARILSLHIPIGYFACTQVAAQITKSLQRALITASASPTTCDCSPTSLQSTGHTDAKSLIFKLTIHTASLSRANGHLRQFIHHTP